LLDLDLLLGYFVVFLHQGNTLLVLMSYLCLGIDRFAFINVVEVVNTNKEGDGVYYILKVVSSLIFFMNYSLLFVLKLLLVYFNLLLL
jgi:hypothetical protein